MAVAIGGTLWFCKTLFLVAGEMAEGTRFLSALAVYAGTLIFCAAVVMGSWISGVKYGKSALENR
jgi:hypothetical protein